MSGAVGRRWASKQARIDIRVQPSVLAALHARAALTGRPLSEIAREAIQHYLATTPATPSTPSWDREDTV